jgi:hypothetical protein
MSHRREHTIELVKHTLLRRGMPRLLVSLILMLTGLAGFFVSFSLLHIGVTWMWLRYPLAILLAYCVFLLLLRLWLSFQRSENQSLDIGLDLSGVDFGHSDPAGYAEGFKFTGTGGDAGGGGAGGSWSQSISSSSSLRSNVSSTSGGIDLNLDLDEAWWLILALIAILGGLIATLYVVYIAPALLAEILIDGVLLTGLYKKLKGIEQRYWLWTAVRKTLLPALIAALFFSVAGYAMQKAAPQARSVGEVWKSVIKS